MHSKVNNTDIILGFDFGMKYIGVAVGQGISKTATPIASLRSKDGIPDWDQVAILVKEWKPTQLIVGIPLNMDDTKQNITYCAQKFANRLGDYYKLPVQTVDERLSTWEAKQRMQSSRDYKDYEKINAMAAAILVEQWFG